MQRQLSHLSGPRDGLAPSIRNTGPRRELAPAVFAFARLADLGAPDVTLDAEMSGSAAWAARRGESWLRARRDGCDGTVLEAGVACAARCLLLGVSGKTFECHRMSTRQHDRSLAVSTQHKGET